MKIMIATTPIRPKPTYFIPIGSLSLLKHLRKSGFDDVEFYNIDGNRPSYDEVLEHLREAKPQVLGISAVVSTAYAYTKKLSQDAKKILPDCLVVVGGNMAASSEVLLKRTGADICVLGEGEVTFSNIAARAEKNRDLDDFKDIKGLMFLDSDGKLVNTGYEAALPGAEIWDYDFDDLEATSNIDTFVCPAFSDKGVAQDWFKTDARAYEPHRRNKTVANLDCSKGCVARCTFCHRWDKGIRSIPVDRIMARLEEMIERYDVGFFQANAETFGADKRWLKEFCEKVSKYDVLWRAPGLRANQVTPDWIKMMQDAGCTQIAFGNETGSARMLEIMEKKLSLDDNYNAVKWTAEANIDAPVQLVLGMPGETDETVAETIKYCQYATTQSAYQSPNDLSINYAQALPGTPLYEYARHAGMIGQDLDGEEAYLLAISDRDAHDEYTTLNFTDSPTLTCRTWRPRITIEVNYHFIKTYGLDRYKRSMSRGADLASLSNPDSGYYANPKRLLEQTADVDDTDERPVPVMPSLFGQIIRGQLGMAMICHPVVFYKLCRFLPVMILLKEGKEKGAGHAWKLLSKYLVYHLKALGRASAFSHGYKSLRKIVEKDIGDLAGDSAEMEPLRKGR